MLRSKKRCRLSMLIASSSSTSGAPATAARARSRPPRNGLPRSAARRRRLRRVWGWGTAEATMRRPAKVSAMASGVGKRESALLLFSVKPYRPPRAQGRWRRNLLLILLFIIRQASMHLEHVFRVVQSPGKRTSWGLIEILYSDGRCKFGLKNAWWQNRRRCVE